jgi:hypothetical protein
MQKKPRESGNIMATVRRTQDLSVPVGIALRPSIKRKAIALARKDGRTLSGLVSHLLAQHLRRNGIDPEEDHQNLE